MEEDRWRKRSREEEEIFKTGEKTRARYETVVLSWLDVRISWAVQQNEFLLNPESCNEICVLCLVLQKKSWYPLFYSFESVNYFMFNKTYSRKKKKYQRKSHYCSLLYYKIFKHVSPA